MIVNKWSTYKKSKPVKKFKKEKPQISLKLLIKIKLLIENPTIVL